MNPIDINNEIEKPIIELKLKFKDTFYNLIQYYSASEKSQLVETFDIWYEVFKSKVRIYSTLSAHFFYLQPYGINEAGENVEIFLRNISFLKEMAIERELEELEEFHKFIEKIKDHIELIGIQINRMDSGVMKIEVIKDKLFKEVEDLKNEIEIKKKEFIDISKDIDKISYKQEKSLQKAKKVQKDFVAILGIFASILIGTFGGISALTSVFTNIKEASTGKLLLFGSFTVLAIILIVFLLLNGISKLTEINLRSCGCANDIECYCSITKKHPTLFIITTLLLSVAITGASSYIINYKELLKNVSQGFLFTGVLFILFVIYASAYAYYFNFNKKLNN